VGDALKDVFLKVSPPRRKLEFNPCLDLLWNYKIFCVTI
jgi:hypothetical protein